MSRSSQSDDLDLMRAVQAGDSRAFDRLVLKYQNTVLNMCCSILRIYEDAEDCAQEVFVRVFRGAANFRFQSSFTTWLYRITVNTCKNRLSSRTFRNRQRTRSLDTGPGDDGEDRGTEVPDSSFSPDRAYERAALQRSLSRALAELGDSHRIMIVLRDIEGRSYEEIAKITGQNTGTVKSRIARAREQLKKRFQEVPVR